MRGPSVEGEIESATHGPGRSVSDEFPNRLSMRRTELRGVSEGLCRDAKGRRAMKRSWPADLRDSIDSRTECQQGPAAQQVPNDF